MPKQETEIKMALSGKACKTTCKVISILAKISEIFLIIGAVAVAISGVVVGIAQKDINVQEIVDQVSQETGTSVVTVAGPALENFLEKSHSEQIVFILVAIAIAAISLFVMSVFARNMYRFFKNLDHDRTPFTMANVDLLQKMATWLFVSIITIDLGSLLLALMCGDGSVGMSVSLSYYVAGFVLLVLAVIFRHGCELEKKVKENKK